MPDSIFAKRTDLCRFAHPDTLQNSFTSDKLCFANRFAALLEVNPMSLEQALHENTAAVRELAGLLANRATPTVVVPSVSRTSTPPTSKRTRAKAADANAAQAAPVVAAVGAEPAQSGPRYFYSVKHDSAWARQPGDPEMDVSGLGAVEIAAEEFAAHEERFAQRYADLVKQNKQAAQITATADTVSADGDDLFGDSSDETFTYQQVVEKLKALTRHPADKGGGMAAVRAVMASDAVKVPNVPSLEKSPEKFAAVMAACRQILEG